MTKCHWMEVALVLHLPLHGRYMKRVLCAVHSLSLTNISNIRQYHRNKPHIYHNEQTGMDSPFHPLESVNLWNSSEELRAPPFWDPQHAMSKALEEGNLLGVKIADGIAKITDALIQLIDHGFHVFGAPAFRRQRCFWSMFGILVPISGETCKGLTPMKCCLRLSTKSRKMLSEFAFTIFRGNGWVVRSWSYVRNEAFTQNFQSYSWGCSPASVFFSQKQTHPTCYSPHWHLPVFPEDYSHGSGFSP